jgi:hypothetical protein
MTSIVIVEFKLKSWEQKMLINFHQDFLNIIIIIIIILV